MSWASRVTGRGSPQGTLLEVQPWVPAGQGQAWAWGGRSLLPPQIPGSNTVQRGTAGHQSCFLLLPRVPGLSQLCPQPSRIQNPPDPQCRVGAASRATDSGPPESQSDVPAHPCPCWWHRASSWGGVGWGGGWSQPLLRSPCLGALAPGQPPAPSPRLKPLEAGVGPRARPQASEQGSASGVCSGAMPITWERPLPPGT